MRQAEKQQGRGQGGQRGRYEMQPVALGAQDIAFAAQDPGQHHRQGPDEAQGRGLEGTDLVSHDPHDGVIAGQADHPGGHGDCAPDLPWQSEQATVGKWCRVHDVVFLRPAIASLRAI